MATLQCGKCFTVPTFFGMCCRSEWQERMYIYKWHEVDQTKHEIFCVHIVCNEIQVKVNLEITTFFFYLRFPYCPNFSDLGCRNKVKIGKINIMTCVNQKQHRINIFQRFSKVSLIEITTTPPPPPTHTHYVLHLISCKIYFQPAPACFYWFGAVSLELDVGESWLHNMQIRLNL